MSPNFHRSQFAALLLCAFALGCSDHPAGGPPANENPPDSGTTPVAESSKANVRFKRSTRLANDFAQALSLPVDGLCKELGSYSCTELVHTIALGGVEPYGIGLYEPLPATGVTTPIVVDRVALSACIARVEADLASPSNAVIFGNIALSTDGKVADLEAPEVRKAFDALYKRTLLRPIQDGEFATLQQLYRDIEASGKPSPGKAWFELGCFTTLTSVESLFY